jgi:ADP-ribose pyrophosphatase YjhB (NUDIX family)
MEIRSIINSESGQEFKIIYNDVDSDKDFQGKKIESVRAYCFYNNQLVVVRELAGHWGIPGGGLEAGEDFRNGIRREVVEETNMKITKMRLVGMHETIRPSGESVFHVRVVCLVEPNGDFKNDPGGEVSEIKLIDPSTFIQLGDFQWGKMADRMLERAVAFKKLMETEVRYVE